jgi:PAS domain S-box-containing protein
MMEQRKKDRQDSLAQTRVAAHCLDRILASVTDALLVTDKNDTIVLVNKAAEKLFGTQAKNLVNTTLQGLLTGYALTVIDLNQVEEEGDIRRFDIEIPAPESQGRLVVQVTSLPVYDTSGTEIEGAVTFFHDLTRQQELDRLKTELVNAAAHELRTPLTSIRGFSELLLEQNFSAEEQKKFLLFINQQSKQLTHIINELLDISSMEAGPEISAAPTLEKLR